MHLVLHWFNTDTETGERKGGKNNADLEQSPAGAPGGEEGDEGKKGPLLHPLSCVHPAFPALVAFPALPL